MNFNVPIIELYSEDFKNTGGASHHSIDFPTEGPLNVIQLRDRSRIHLAEKKPRLLRKKNCRKKINAPLHHFWESSNYSFSPAASTTCSMSELGSCVKNVHFYIECSRKKVHYNQDLPLTTK